MGWRVHHGSRGSRSSLSCYQLGCAAVGHASIMDTQPLPPAISRVWYHNDPPGPSALPGCLDPSMRDGYGRSQAGRTPLPDLEITPSGMKIPNLCEWTRKSIHLDPPTVSWADYYQVNTNVIVSPATARSSPSLQTWCFGNRTGHPPCGCLYLKEGPGITSHHPPAGR